MKFPLFFLGASVLLLSLATATFATQDPTRQPAAAPAQKLHVQSIQADFVQEKHMKMLAHPLESTGKFFYQAPDSLRWEYLAPVRSILLLQNGQTRKFVETDGELHEEPGQAVSSMQFVMGEIANWIDGNFTDNELFTIKNKNARHVELLPKQALEGIISSIELNMTEEQGILESVIIHEGDDAYTQMTFSNQKVNGEFTPDIFAKP